MEVKVHLSINFSTDYENSSDFGYKFGQIINTGVGGTLSKVDTNLGVLAQNATLNWAQNQLTEWWTKNILE